MDARVPKETPTQRRKRLSRERSRRYRERHPGGVAERARQRRAAAEIVDDRDHKELSQQRRLAGTHGDYRDHNELSRQRRVAKALADGQRGSVKEESPRADPVQESDMPADVPESALEFKMCTVCSAIQILGRPAAVVEPYTCPTCSGGWSGIKQEPLESQSETVGFPGVSESTQDSVPPGRQSVQQASTSLE